MNRLPALLAVVKLDIDKARRPSRKRIVQLLGRAGYKLISLWWTRSPSRKGWHVWIRVSPCPRTPMEVIALQAMLGSDPLRESMNVLRARKFWNTPQFARSWYNVLYKG